MAPSMAFAIRQLQLGISLHGAERSPAAPHSDVNVSRPPSLAAVDGPRSKSHLRLGVSLADQVYRFVQSLDDPETKWRQRAADRLGALAEASEQSAEIIAKHTRKLASKCGDQEAVVRGAIVGALQSLADGSQARIVAVHAPFYVQCLSDKDRTVRRKTAALYRAVADGGEASAVVAHLPKIVEFLASEDALRVTPLRALEAFANRGQANAVSALGLEQIIRALSGKTAAVRVAACDALTSICKGGSSETLWSNFDSLTGNNHIIDKLISLSRTGDADARQSRVISRSEEVADVRQSSLCALRAFGEAHLEASQLLRDWRRETIIEIATEVVIDDELRRGLLALVGHRTASALSIPPLVGNQTWINADYDESDSGSDDEDERLECSICQGALGRHGQVASLPCGHSFHARCIGRWLNSRVTGTCPNCRHQPYRRPSNARSDGRRLSRLLQTG